MRPFIYYLTAFLVLSSFLSQGAEIKVQIKPYKEYEKNEFTVCIEKYSPSSGYYTDFDDMYVQKKAYFELKDLETGRYILALMHPSSEILLYHVFLPKDDTVVELDVELDQVTISAKIDSIRIVGDFNGHNHWRNGLKMKYDESNKYWFYSLENFEKDLGEHYFVLNYNEKTHTPELPVAKKINPWADYNQLAEKGSAKIIFDPSKLNQGKANPKITVRGVDEGFHETCEALNSIRQTVSDKSRSIKDEESLESYRQLYNVQMKKLDELINKSGDSSSWLFPDIQFTLLNLAPIERESYMAMKERDMNKMTEIRSRPEYLENMKEKALLLSNLEKNKLMLTPNLIRSLYYFGKFQMNQYNLYEELNIPFGYFDQFLFDLKNEIDDDEIGGEIAYIKARDFVRTNPGKAEERFKEIKNKYPEYSAVKNGRIDKELKALSIKNGVKAPEFELEALNGEMVNLSSLRGKYVFLDFWGTWCAPCIGEIPNIKTLHEEIPEDELVVIGIVCRDTKEKVSKYIAKNDVMYKNAMADDKILSDYGIRAFPTTILIDREGNITGKNLRGPNLVDMVREAMQ